VTPDRDEEAAEKAYVVDLLRLALAISCISSCIRNAKIAAGS
jgi:hypothetical protein